MPPSAMTVCALPSSDLQTIPTETPAAAASMAARKPGAASSDHQHIMVMSLVFGHQRILQSVQMPSEHSRT